MSNQNTTDVKLTTEQKNQGNWNEDHGRGEHRDSDFSDRPGKSCGMGEDTGASKSGKPV